MRASISHESGPLDVLSNVGLSYGVFLIMLCYFDLCSLASVSPSALLQQLRVASKPGVQ